MAHVDRCLRRRRQHPQSVWKLLGAGAVGSQALTGIPVVSRLRHDSVLASVSRVWPFEVMVPDFRPGASAIVHVEIWPSLTEVPETTGEVKDQTQVTRLAMRFREEDRSGTLSDLFGPLVRRTRLLRKQPPPHVNEAQRTVPHTNRSSAGGAPSRGGAPPPCRHRPPPACRRGAGRRRAPSKRAPTRRRSRGRPEAALARIAPVAAGHALTPTEACVAELVASGHSKKEVAAQLYMSVKTVEANLSRIFAKLDVRSRTERRHGSGRVGDGGRSQRS